MCDAECGGCGLFLGLELRTCEAPPKAAEWGGAGDDRESQTSSATRDWGGGHAGGGEEEEGSQRSGHLNYDSDDGVLHCSEDGEGGADDEVGLELDGWSEGEGEGGAPAIDTAPSEDGGDDVFSFDLGDLGLDGLLLEDEGGRDGADDERDTDVRFAWHLYKVRSALESLHSPLHISFLQAVVRNRTIFTVRL